MKLFALGLLLGVAALAPAQEFVVLGAGDFTATPTGYISRAVPVGPEVEEIIPSWRLFTSGARISIEVVADGPSAKFDMADWANRGRANRSFAGQKGPLGQVYTDTISLAKPAQELRVHIDGPVQIHEFYLSLSGKMGQDRDGDEPSAAWGRTLEPPKHAQSTYPNGGVLCSPTSTSMVLGYWARELQQPRLDLRTPDLVPLLWDHVYGGAGNWSFNMATAGSQPGLVGYVTRLRGIRDIETWIANGVPVVTSVSYDLLKGKTTKSANDGHLVVVVGFDAQGNPIFNDPGRGIVRLSYRREHFRRAWESSGRTVYLLYPRNWRLTNPGPWRKSPEF